MTDSTDTISVSLSIDGYEVDVTVYASSIERAIKQAEQEASEEFVFNGPSECIDLSKYASVSAEPTDEKWEELAGEI